MEQTWKESKEVRDKKVVYSNISTKELKTLKLDLSNHNKVPLGVNLFTNYYTVKVNGLLVHEESYLEKRWIKYSDVLNGLIEIEVPEEGNNKIDSWWVDSNFNKEYFEELR